MKMILSVFALFYASMPFAQANEVQVVPLSNLSITVTSGCGQPPPDGRPCDPQQANAVFTVKSGGPCHTYTADVQRNDKTTYVTFLDSAMPHCTRPEIFNYVVRLKLDSRFILNSVQLVNPIYVDHFFNP